ncbi:hypothetical protein I302_106511 [Kwoniella bestiolae CBS 10118]|uniref:Golgi-body localization protein domain-containing protein n=1 Tax=Kwoniella bestiolae CBS 10118 TaxID=1296100 RepID=A0AAJ8KBX8_9TREE
MSLSTQLAHPQIYLTSTILVLLLLIWTRGFSSPFYLLFSILSIWWKITRFSIKWTFYLVIPSLLPQYYILWPWVIRHKIPQARASRFSIVGAFRGLEWKKDNVNVRAESGAWRWGGRKAEGVGYFVYRVEDVVVRARSSAGRTPQSNGPTGTTLPLRSRLPPLLRSMFQADGVLVKNFIWIVQVVIHYIPGFARLLSLELKNCRIILEDFDNIELVFDEFSFGAMINFQGVAEAEATNAYQANTPTPSPQAGCQEFMRQNPLIYSPSIAERGRKSPLTFSPPSSPPWSPVSSPPMSPTFGSLAVPDPILAGIPDRQRSTSRLADARRRASVFSSSTSATAGYVWNRVTGRLYGSIVGTASVVNVRLVQPKSSSTHHSQHVSSQPLSNSTSFRSIHALLRHNTAAHLPSISSDGYECFMGISGRTKASLGLGFGPKKGLWGEDTLEGQVQAGEITGKIEGVQKLLDMAKRHKRKAEKRPVQIKSSRWSSRGWSRTVLRAIKSVNVNLQKFTVVHYLSSPSNSSKHFGSPPSSPDRYTVSVDLTHLDLTLIAADSSNNERARNAFGTNSNPDSKIRGVGFAISWESINLDCLAPQETSEEKSQLFVIQNGTLDGFSSWRPAGWKREELLFSSDPNLALIVLRGEVGSINTAIDLQLLHELAAAWRLTHPKEKAQEAVDHVQQQSQHNLPPRLRMVFDVGHISAHLADRLSENTTAVTFDSDGVHLGCFTAFSDLIGRRRDKATTKKAFEDEEKIRESRNKLKCPSLAVASADLPPEARRSPDRPTAFLYEDYSTCLRGDAQMNIEPIRIKIKLSDDRFSELATVGRMHGMVGGDVFGRREVIDGRGFLESTSFDWSSLSSSLDLGIDEGIHINLWRKDVIDALIAMGKAHQQGSPSHSSSSTTSNKSPLARLPSGMSARVSLGNINLFVGHEDINPSLDTKNGPPVRGTWIQTSAVFEYALYRHYAQAFPWRHQLTAPTRVKLHLPEDITVQALAFASRYRPNDGSAALTSLVVEDLVVQPIYNGQRFTARGGTRQKLVVKAIPPNDVKDDKCHWGSQRLWARLKALRDKDIQSWPEDRRRETSLPSLESYIPRLDYNVPPIEATGTEQAQRPWLRIKNTRLHLTIQQTKADVDTEFKVTARFDNVGVISNYSHLYSNLHTALTLRKLVNGWKRPKGIDNTPRQPSNFSISILIPNLTAHFAFPLKEQIYVYSSHVSITKPPSKGLSVSADQALVYVPSPTVIGDWEELGRIKKLAVHLSDPGAPLVINPKIEAIRVRIPHKYLMNSLILDINVTIKALKVILRNFFKSNEFITRHTSLAEEPKHVPNICLEIGYMSFEAKDDAADTNLNLIWRAGFLEQAKRNSLEDAFAKKIALMNSSNSSSEDSLHNSGSNRPEPKLTKKATVDAEDARQRLDAYLANNWIKRMRAAKHEQRRREAITLKPMHGCGPNIKLPINIVPSSQTAPLFRATFQNVNFSVSDPGLDRKEIIEYMGKVSSPFDEGTEFSLMVPLKLDWTMSEAKCTLRDYPLPMLKIQPSPCVPSQNGTISPTFQMTSTIIIAEEFANDDSTVYVPVEILPKECGGPNLEGFSIDVAKTIMPVKMYGEPRFKVNSKKTTEFTWGMSYQFGVQDFVKVIETFSHPPRDPSPKLGAVDKMRLICHLKPIVEFEGPVHLHLKGTFDPYQLTGLGAGFALAWKGNTKLLINQPNEDREAVQIVADNLLVAIPDLTALNDSAATGSPTRSDDTPSPGSTITPGTDESESSLINRRYTKPCAKFVNGTKVGFGFGRERTCRPWDCACGCGDEDNHLHRKCRMFDFLPHQKVILRSPEAIRKEEERVGRPVDSYEGFRSDYTHFSVSVIAPTHPFTEQRLESEDPAHVNSFHCTPKAMHHFLRWWRLFNHVTWLPTREGPYEGGSPGSLYIGSRRKSKKESKPLATLKVTKELWAQGKSESLGIKVRAGRLLFDAHQRLQEKMEYKEKLQEFRANTHRPLYAADVVADDLTIKGIRAHFIERVRLDPQLRESLPRASELPQETKVWFDLTDYIDADRKPLDEDPQVEIVDFGDCPHVYFCRRTNTNDLNENGKHGNNSNGTSRSHGIESSKFGFEKTHHCYLDEAETRAEVDERIVKKRIAELQARLDSYPTTNTAEYRNDQAITQNAINLLQKNLIDIERDNPDQYDDSGKRKSLERPFQDTIEVHSPRLFYNDLSRPLLWAYMYSVSDRRKEEYHVSHVSLRNYREQFIRRRKRFLEALDNSETHENNVPEDMVGELAHSLVEKPLDSIFQCLNIDNNPAAYRTASLGLPAECTLKPKLQISIFKPQIALRSNATESAIVLLAVQEASIKRFSVEDPETGDDMTSDVLTRTYALLKEVQAFYPTTEALNRERSGSISRGLDFVPLEIFLDAKSQATDYDRILLRTNLAGSYDKFNRLRIPRQLKWPKAINENGDPIEHLRIHQDLMTIITPQIKLFATSKHYDALYTIITDLLIYSDPDHQHRNQAVKDFSRQFDSSDRDTNRLLVDIHTLQQTMRHLMELQRGYETNLEKLEEAGKDELFKIRADLAEGYESLYTINAMIANTLAKDDARAFLKNALRLDIRLREVSWRMLKEDCISSLAQVTMSSALCSYSNNKNGSTDCALVLGSVQVNNLAPDAKFEGMIVSQDNSSWKKKAKSVFAKVYWSSYPPIGGIPVFPEVDVELASVRFGIEEKMGHQVVDYIFSDRIRRRRDKAKLAQQQLSHTNGSSTPNANASPLNGKADTRSISSRATLSTDDLSVASSTRNELYPLSRSRSQVSINSHNDVETISTYGNSRSNDDAKEMRERASTNRYFGKISFHRMNLTLSYTRDDTRKHSTLSMPECANFSFKAPDLVYTGKYWVPEEIFEHVKKDLKSAAFAQWSELIPQIFKQTSLFRSKRTLRNLTERTTKAVGNNLPSPLKHITTHTSTSTSQPFSEDETGVERIKSGSVRSHHSPSHSHETSPPMMIPQDQVDTPSTFSTNGSGSGSRSVRSNGGVKSDEEEDEHEHREKGLKGLLGKFGVGKHHNHSTDELSRSRSRVTSNSSLDRKHPTQTPSVSFG